MWRGHLPPKHKSEFESKVFDLQAAVMRGFKPAHDSTSCSFLLYFFSCCLAAEDVTDYDITPSPH